MTKFRDFGFTLVIANQLLKNSSFSGRLDELLQRPDIADCLDGVKNYGETIPEVEQFFRELEFTDEDLAKIEYLGFDGGLQIYQLVRPYWDGEDLDFDTLSVDGFEKLPNLKKAQAISMIGEKEFSRLLLAGAASV
jgi:hypothetical protein